MTFTFTSGPNANVILKDPPKRNAQRQTGKVWIMSAAKFHGGFHGNAEEAGPERTDEGRKFTRGAPGLGRVRRNFQG